ncbi:MAG: hypothetical protein ACOH2B_08730 [Burkholderiaceae bacterium]
MLTNFFARVGWMPMVASNCAFVALQRHHHSLGQHNLRAVLIRKAAGAHPARAAAIGK